MKRIYVLLCAAITGLSGIPKAAHAELTAFAEEEQVFQGMTYIIDDGLAVITGYTAALPDELTIPARIESNPVGYIQDDAFLDCSQLKRVTVSSNAIIGKAFRNCSNLECVVLPDTVTQISASAFENCTALTEINIPSGISRIPDKLLSGCKSLKAIQIPDTITEIGASAFENCTGLTEIVIPESVQSIQREAFSGCSNLTAVQIPEATDVSGDALNGTAWLTAKQAEDPLVMLSGKLLNGSQAKGEVTVPDGVTGLSKYSFFESAVSGIVIPASTTKIGSYAFQNCTELSSVTILGNIGNLSAADLTAGKPTKGAVEIFKGCSNLREITVLNPFCDFDPMIQRVPTGAVIRGYENSSAHKNAEKWGTLYQFESLGEAPEQMTGDFDGDGEITARDAQGVLNAYTETVAGGESALMPQQVKACDIDGDGAVKAADAQYILVYFTENTLAHKAVTWADILQQ